jgi:hypothetical protein
MIGILQYQDSLDTGFSLCLSGDMTAEDVRDTLHYAARSNHGRQTDIERQARQILVGFGHDPDRPGDIKAPAESRTIVTAHSVLRHIRLWRNAMASGDCQEASRRASEIWSLVSRHDFLIDHEAAIRRGRAFIKGPKNRRTDALGEAIIKVLSEHGLELTAKQVAKKLKENRDLDVDEDYAIFWKRASGKEKMTTFKALEKRLPGIRKALRKRL